MDIALQKIKKAGESMRLELRKNPDITAAVRAAQPKLFMVEFTAETEDLAARAQTLLAAKQLQLVAANAIGSGQGFGQDHNAVELFWPQGQQTVASASKADIAAAVVDCIARLYHA